MAHLRLIAEDFEHSPRTWLQAGLPKVAAGRNLHQLIPMNGSSYPHLHTNTTQLFRTGAAESRNFLIAPRNTSTQRISEKNLNPAFTPLVDSFTIKGSWTISFPDSRYRRINGQRFQRSTLINSLTKFQLAVLLRCQEKWPQTEGQRALALQCTAFGLQCDLHNV